MTESKLFKVKTVPINLVTNSLEIFIKLINNIHTISITFD